MIRFAITLCLLTILFHNGSAQAQYAQRAILRSYNGESISMNNYEPDLRNKNFDNRAVSICVTGVWMVYENVNYNNQHGIMEFLFGPQNSTGPYCFTFRNLQSRVSSIRYAGSLPDYRSDTITLFQRDYFQGAEEYTFQDLPHLSLANSHASLIITGSSSWTLYDLPNYLGNARCASPLQSNNYKPAFIYNVNNIGIQHNSIKSIRKGCFSS